MPKNMEDCSINGNSSIPDGDTCRTVEDDDDDILFLFCIILDIVVVDADGDNGDVDDVLPL